MATIAKGRARPAYTISGNTPELRYFPEGANCSFKYGSIAFLNGSGRIRGVSRTGNVSPVELGLIRGVAGLTTRNATPIASWTADTKVGVWMANNDTVFSQNIIGRTAALSTLSYGMIGSWMTASITGGGCSSWWLMRGNTATGSIAYCRGFEDERNDTNGRVYFQFIHTIRNFR